MMKGPQQKSTSGSEERPWSKEEDDKLIECKSRNGHLSWQDITMLAGLNRSGKSCRERWNNCVGPHVKSGNFSQEGDNSIIQNRSRTDSDIKNHRNKLKLGRSIDKNIPDPQSSSGDQSDATQFFHRTQNIPKASSIPTQEIANPSFPEDDDDDDDDQAPLIPKRKSK